MLGLAIQSFITILFLFNRSYHVAYLLCFVLGFGITGKQYVGWNYLLEMQPSNKQV